MSTGELNFANGFLLLFGRTKSKEDGKTVKSGKTANELIPMNLVLFFAADSD